MKWRTLKYLWAEGFRGIQRHRTMSFTAIATMVASLLVLGVFLLTSYNVRSVLDDLEGRKEVMVYLTDAVTQEEREMIEERLGLHPAVSGFRFISKEEAWETFATSVDAERLLEAVGANPLPNSYELKLHPDKDTAPIINSLAAEVRGWDEVEDVVTGGPWVAQLDRFARAVLLFTLVVGVAVALSIVAIVANTVRLTVFARADLIDIMKSVGASETFIRIPFLSEGLIQSFFAGAAALGILYGATVFLSTKISGVVFLSPQWMAGFLGAALILGLAGSAISVRHVLNRVGL